MTSPPSHIPNPGDVIGGKYRVDGTIGAGGMAVVLSATHEMLRQRVAVKVLQPKYAASHELRERFFREARALAALRSEHITRVFDVGVLENGAAYLVLEHLDGHDLHEVLLRDGPLSWRRAVRYIVQAAEGLKEAHGLGILHRDIKPSNMFLVPDAKSDGKIKLLDFGLAKLTEEGVTSLTGGEVVMGSPSYMSPEQIQGLTNADARSDIWSLGVTLYELLTDGYPFEADQAMKIAAAVIVEKPKPLAPRTAVLPPGLEEAIMSCLVKDPAKRTPSADALIRKLVPFLSVRGYEPVSAASPTLTSIKPYPSSDPGRTSTRREAEETYGGMMPSVADDEDDGKSTLVQFPNAPKRVS